MAGEKGVSLGSSGLVHTSTKVSLSQDWDMLDRVCQVGEGGWGQPDRRLSHCLIPPVASCRVRGSVLCCAVLCWAVQGGALWTLHGTTNPCPALPILPRIIVLAVKGPMCARLLHLP